MKKIHSVLLLTGIFAATLPQPSGGISFIEKSTEIDRKLHNMGMVVRFDLAKNAAPKIGLNAISNANDTLFSTASLTQTGGGTLSLSGSSNRPFPRWARITWREGVDEKAGLYWTTGHITGDYQVEVLNRIPAEVFTYISAAKGRVIVLRFRIKDDDVMFAWDVQEMVSHPSGGSGFVFSMHGGDFPCDTNPYQKDPNCTEGRLEDTPWYNLLWTRG